MNKNLEEKGISLRSLLLGIFLAIVMGAANAYLGLKVGMTVTASIPAAVLSILILRGMLKTGTIFESNLVQTAASAGEALAAGIIFTVPGFLMIGFWQDFDFFTTCLIAIAGGVLGALLMIPMRKVFIAGDFKDLPYPEAKATAAVLEAGHHPGGETKAQAINLIRGTVIGGAIQLLTGFFGLFKSTLEFGFSAFNRVFFVGADISPALMGIGYIVGLEVSIQVFLGGFIGWMIILPILSGGADLSQDLVDVAWGLWSTKTRYVGVGALIIGGLISIYKSRMGFVKAIDEIKQMMVIKTEEVDERDRDMSIKSIVGLSLVCAIAIFFLYYYFTQNIGVTIISTIVMAVLAFFFTAVACYIVAIVGNSNSPISGLNISAVLITGLLLLVFGYTGMQGMAAVLGVAAIICCVSAVSGDACNDLKTGHIIGASPFKQQIMQILGVISAGLFMGPILKLLHDNTPGGIGGRELAAPQASLLSSLAEGLFSPEGALPWDLVFLGMAIGVGLFIISIIIERMDLNFKLHVMPVAIGIYLPFPLTLPMLAGGALYYFTSRKIPESEKEEKTRSGVLFSSGFIAGESLMGVFIALLASLGFSRMSLPIAPEIHTLISLGAIVGMFLILAYYSRIKNNK